MWPLKLALSLEGAGHAAPVVGGAPAPEGRWPDLVAVYAHGSVHCTGVLIAPDLVLTAGHCGLDNGGVEVGGLTLGDGERIRVVGTRAHPDPFTTFDAELLVLDHPAQAPPRILARDCIVEDWLVDGAPVTIVGYGATDLLGSEWPQVPHQ